MDDSLRSLIAQHGVGETRSGGILIVDDEKPNLTVLRSFLETGYKVCVAQSGPEALEIAKKTDLDIVIADQRMPQMTGVELLEELRQLKPDIAGIVLTGFTDPPALISAINRARVFRFLKKPWQPEELLAAVREAASEYDGLVERAEENAFLRSELDKLHHRVTALESEVARLRPASAT